MSAGRFCAGGTTGEDLYRDIQVAARSDSPVLISGGDALGRRSVVQQIHRQSSRRAGPLVVIDRRLATQLFGASKRDESACPLVTALGDRDGSSLIDPAVGGTLLIEEVAELTVTQQTQLLKFLDRRGIHGHTMRADVGRDPRIVAATGHRLFDRLGTKEFRADLFYRLNSIHIVLPTVGA